MATNQTSMNKAGAVGQAQNDATGSEEWDEERLEVALKQLQLLHVKCRELRATIPQILEPLSSSGNGIAQSVNDSFTTTVKLAIADVNNFKSLYMSAESKKVLDQAKKSREAEPKGIKPWRARDHPDWLELDE